MSVQIANEEVHQSITLAPESVRKQQKKRALKENLKGYAFISPFIIGFLAFTLIPILTSLYLSFTNYNLFATPSWIGLANYKKMFTADPRFWHALKNTLIYVFCGVPLRLAFALLIAMMLNTASRAVGLYRSLFYLPSLIGGSVSVAIMWRNIFGDQGIINLLLHFLGIPVVHWFGSPTAALWMLIFLSVWQFGSSMLIFLAGLKGIPKSFYEAASIDGANSWTQFTKVTLPMLSPIILFNLVMQTISAFMTFVPAFIISKGTGDPMDGTLLYSLYLFVQGFSFFNMGYASAMAWIMLILVGLLTGIIFLTSKLWVHYE